MTLFEATGNSCGTVTHAMSYTGITGTATDLFSNLNNGYSWYSNDYNAVGQYQVTVTATESGCNTVLTETYIVDV